MKIVNKVNREVMVQTMQKESKKQFSVDTYAYDCGRCRIEDG